MSSCFQTKLFQEFLIFVGFLLVVSFCQIPQHPGIGVLVGLNGTYMVTIGGKPWFHSSDTSFTMNGKKYSVGEKTLSVKGFKEEEGKDKLGMFRNIIFTLGTRDNFTMVTEFKSYVDTSGQMPVVRPFVILTQSFPEGLPSCSVNDKNQLATAFPSIVAAGNGSMSLGFLAYGGIMYGDTGKAMGVWGKENHKIASGLDSGPLVLFTEDNKNAVVISPFNEFMAASAVHGSSDGSASWGIIGSMSSLPKGFSYQTIMYYSPQGIQKAMMGWGDVLRAQYNRDTSFRAADMSINYLGYWTDNGAYYYYLTEPQKNYEETLVDVKKYADEENIPYRYIQYDSWWYPKGAHSGVIQWDSMNSVFPNGLKKLWEETSLPVVAHNRFWSDKTTYAKQNGGSYDFIVEPKTSKAIPTEEKFWDDLLRYAKQWGLITYEQDWLNVEFNEMEATVSDVSLGRTWLNQMGEGAARNGLTVQYCMAPSRAALQALQIPTVTQARASGDYHPGNDQWRIGVSSIFVQALGVAPFKDNFWTTTDQPGNNYHTTEPYPALQSVVATLSTGPVGPSDMVKGSNVSLIMRSCNAEGLILKPSVPAFAIDDQIIRTAFEGESGEIWSTWSKVSDMYFGIIMAADVSKTYTVGPSHAFPAMKWPTSAVFKYNDPTGDSTPFSDEAPLTIDSKCTKSHFCLYYTTPILSLNGQEMVILGELDKWVPVSPQRVSSISITDSDISINLHGAPNEVVNFAYVMNTANGAMRVDVKCTISGAGTAVISALEQMCF